MAKNCKITFDQNEHGTYFTGQMVTGKVFINFNKTKKLKGIKLQICGYACATWRVRHGRNVAVVDGKRRGKRTYYGLEDYISSTTFLIGSEQGPNMSIEAGDYVFSFACPIPSNCPSSYEGTYGHIRYMAKVIFVRSGAANRTHNVGFTVLKLLDLNHESKLLKEPASSDAIEYFCLMHAKPVHLQVNIQQTGFVPGQFVLVNAHVRNDSHSNCKKLLIELYLRATYTADTPALRTATEKIMLAKKECGPVPYNSEKNFCETLRIPATAPTCEHLSKVVRVSYELHVRAVMDWLMASPKAVLPITIGNVPLALMPTQNLAPPNGPLAPLPCEVPTTSAMAMQLAGQAMEADLDDFDLPEDGDDEFETEEEVLNELPPPTYEEAMFMSTDIADTDVNTVSESSRFAPRYPVFDIDSFRSPPPNPPQKRRRRRRKRQTTEQPPDEQGKEKPLPPRSQLQQMELGEESPVQI